MVVTCYNCAFCATRDVFNGFCEKEFKDVLVDEARECSIFEERKKCRNCANYKETDRLLGSCMDKVPTYPDLFACNDYVRA